MTKQWEYAREVRRHKIDYEAVEAQEKRAAEFVAWMNTMGLQGWELVYYNAGVISNTDEWLFTLWKRELMLR